MAYELVHTKSINATASLENSQYCFVQLDVNGKLTLPLAGGYAIGVLQDKPKAGDPGAVCSPGDVTKVVAGGVLHAGENVQTDASGRAVTTSTGVHSLGQCLMAASAAGEVISILFQPSATS